MCCNMNTSLFFNFPFNRFCWSFSRFAGDGDGVGLHGHGDEVTLDGKEDGFALGGLPEVGLEIVLVSLNCNLSL